MGKPKQPDPEPERIVRSLGENLSIEVSEEEKKYRNKNGPDDVNDIPRDKLKCTVCTKSVSDIIKKSAEPFVHMVLGVLMCKECSSFYGDGYFSVDEDGDDKYCRWCGQGGTLYNCSKCTCAFCKKCIKQNLSRQDVKDLESDDWQCLICSPKPLYECRTICWALQEYAQAKKNSQVTENEKGEEDEEEEEEVKASKSKNKKSGKSSKYVPGPLSSKKRKASEIEPESDTEKHRSSKRRKSSDSTQDTKRKGSDTPAISSKRSQNKMYKSKELIDSESEEEDYKPASSKSRNSKSKKRS